MSVPSVLRPWSGEKGEFEGLNPQQQLAIEALLSRQDFDLTEACRTAGYASPSSVANKLMKHPIVRKILARRMAQRCDDLGLDPKRTMLEIARISYLDSRKICDPVTGNLLHLKDMDADVAACVSSVKVTKRIISRAKADDPEGIDEDEQVTEIKFWSKPAGLEMMAKHQGILKELAQNNFNVNIVGPDFWDGLAKQVASANEDEVEKRLAAARVESIERDTSKEEIVDAETS